MSIPPVYLINLRRRPDRLLPLVERLRSLGFPTVHAVEAVDGKNLTMNPWLDKMFANNDFGSRRSVIGCACSHYFLWKHIAEDESISGHVLILEDDCKLVDNVIAKLQEQVSAIASRSFVLLGYHRQHAFPLSLAPVESVSIEPLDKGSFCGGFFAYMIDRATARSMVDFCDTHGIKYGIDMVIPLETTIPVHCILPPLVHSPIASASNKVDTDIQRDYVQLPIAHVIQPVIHQRFVLLKDVEPVELPSCTLQHSYYLLIANIMHDCMAVSDQGKVYDKPSALVPKPGAALYVKRPFCSSFA